MIKKILSNNLGKIPFKKIHKIFYNFLQIHQSIGLSTIIALILHAENLYSNTDYSRSEIDEKSWENFLTILTTHAATIKENDISLSNTGGQQTTMDSQILKNIIQHLTRFSSLQTKPLLNILTQVDNNAAAAATSTAK